MHKTSYKHDKRPARCDEMMCGVLLLLGPIFYEKLCDTKFRRVRAVGRNFGTTYVELEKSIASSLIWRRDTVPYVIILNSNRDGNIRISLGIRHISNSVVIFCNVCLKTVQHALTLIHC